MSQLGPCIGCGATNYALSLGGPSLCPSCDCGVKPGTVPPAVFTQYRSPPMTDKEAPLDERAKFEAAMRPIFPLWTFQSDGVGGYHNHATEAARIAWETRAASPSLPLPSDLSDEQITKEWRKFFGADVPPSAFLFARAIAAIRSRLPSGEKS